MLTDCQLEVLSPGNYTCDIYKLDFPKIISIRGYDYIRIETYITSSGEIICTNKMYLVNNLLTGEKYWATLNILSNNNVYFKLIYKINVKNDKFETLYEPKCRIIYDYNKYNYSIYTTSVPLHRIPLSYKIISNSRKKWDELCELIIKNKINIPISYVINISELRQYINVFF
jgi:hypothetical protein